MPRNIVEILEDEHVTDLATKRKYCKFMEVVMVASLKLGLTDTESQQAMNIMLTHMRENARASRPAILKSTAIH